MVAKSVYTGIHSQPDEPTERPSTVSALIHRATRMVALCIMVLQGRACTTRQYHDTYSSTGRAVCILALTVLGLSVVLSG
jgi:hypothetical protein